jgi:outer membrane lipoprotein LolB
MRGGEVWEYLTAGFAALAPGGVRSSIFRGLSKAKDGGHRCAQPALQFLIMALPHPFKSLTRLPLLCLCVLLAACAAEPPVPLKEREAEWRLHREALAALKAWRLEGRIAVRHGDEGWTASLQWREEEGGYVLRLSAPLGRGTVELSGSPRGVQMVTADNRLLHADTPEALMEENLGWHVPLSGLRYWVKGTPEPGRPAERLTLDEEGRASAFRQDGWQVTYDRYEEAGPYRLPGKITRFSTRMRAPAGQPAAERSARAARTTRSSSSGIPLWPPSRTIAPSLRTSNSRLSPNSTNWNTVCSS